MGALCLWQSGEARELYQLDFKPPERGERGSPERGETTALSSIGPKGGGGSARGWCEEMRGSGGPFIGDRGGEKEEVACTSEARCDNDDGAQWWRRDGSGRQWRRDGSVTGRGDARRQFG